MKESITHIDHPRLLFRETFEDEQSVRRNGGTPTDVTFSNGVGEFNGTSSGIDYPILSALTNKSIRFIGTINATNDFVCNIENLFSIRTVSTTHLAYRNSGAVNVSMDFTAYLGETVEVVFTDANGTLKVYLNGAEETDSSTTGSIPVSTFKIGQNGADGAYLNGSLDLFEIYNYILSAEEIANMAEGKRFHELGVHGEQLGAELVTSLANSSANPYETIAISGSSVTSAINTAANASFYDDTMNLSIVSGERYRLTFDYVQNSGAAPDILLMLNGDAITGSSSNTYTPVAGSNSTVLVATSTGAGRELAVWTNAASNFSMTNISLKKILVEETSEILNVSAQSGSIIDRWGNTLTNTATTVAKDGEVRAMKFDGATSKVDCGNPDDLTGDITCVAWAKMYTKGAANGGRIFDNGKFWIRQTANPLTYYSASSDGGSTNASGNASSNDFTYNEWHQIVVTRSSSGVTNIYINGVQSGIANQSSGTPVAGSTNLLIGADNAGLYNYDGLISDVRIINGILSTKEISQLFSDERSKYGI